MTPGQMIAERLLSMDWAKVVLDISAARKWRIATIARQIDADAEGLRRIVRGQVTEPRIKTAIKLLDLHAEVHGEFHGSQ